MTIKAISFDLDGVLVDTKRTHFDALNMALAELSEDYIITERQHAATFDGLKTNEKLEILTKTRGLPEKYHRQIWNKKQDHTVAIFNKTIKNNEILQSILKDLSASGLKIACCSNSIRSSTIKMLELLGVKALFDLIISNEDVKYSKPHPQMYWEVMIKFGIFPDEMIVFEDSPPGLRAAYASGSHVVRVSEPSQINLEFVANSILRYNGEMKNIWANSDINVLIPMAGRGSRFESAGYTFPKPLIDVSGKPMIQVVVENLGVEGNYIFVVQKEHREKYSLDLMLDLIAPGCSLVEVDGVTEGAAVTTLLARDLIDNNSPLIIANSDQYLDWNPVDFFYSVQERKPSGAIVTFESTHPKWSFAKISDEDLVTQVAEKSPISSHATAGVYYWAMGSDYVKYADQMIEKNIRTNGEFYVCPVYNEAIGDGMVVKSYSVDGMWGLGTPEDLEAFLLRDSR
jgi:HAD superfamily hydrolase (TIGR01509 family)